MAALCARAPTAPAAASASATGNRQAPSSVKASSFADFAGLKAASLSLSLPEPSSFSQAVARHTQAQSGMFHRRESATTRSSTSATNNTSTSSNNHETGGSLDLLVVGAGVLGTMIGQHWLKVNPGGRAFGQTRTTSRHGEIESAGLIPVAGAPVEEGTQKLLRFPFVVFCAPPYGNEDYPGEVRRATESWDGQGSFLFTSSSALYDVSDNGLCYEEDPGCPSVPKGRAARLDNLLDAEEASFNAGGNVVRLAGLYTKDRGAHTYWLKQGTVDSRPDHILNLISYEDAASLCVAILAAQPPCRRELFMGCDNHPLSREELIAVTLRSGVFQGATFQGFTGTEGPLGKRMNNSKTRQRLGWSPKHNSLEEFLASAPALA